MTILGIDPGSRKTGYGLVKKTTAGFSTVSAGVIRLDKIDDFNERLFLLHREVSAVIRDFSPSVMAIEKAFLGKNVSSAFKLGAARAVCILAGKESAIQIFEYSPREVKQGITGHGGAEKEQVQKAVCSVLKLGNTKLQADAADALAIAIFHGNLNPRRLTK